jgi:hypothetical protein
MMERGQTQRGPASRVVPSSGRPGELHSIQHGAVAVKSLGGQGVSQIGASRITVAHSGSSSRARSSDFSLMSLFAAGKSSIKQGADLRHPEICCGLQVGGDARITIVTAQPPGFGEFRDGVALEEALRSTRYLPKSLWFPLFGCG